MKKILLLCLVFLTIAIVGCTQAPAEQPKANKAQNQAENNQPSAEPVKPKQIEVESNNEEKAENNNQKESEESKETTKASWFDNQFKDVESSETFSVSDFAGEVVLLESFATWCPKCKNQQRETGALHKEVDFVSITMNIDPNEDEEDVLSYKQANGFEGHYVVADKAFTSKLIEEFGTRVVSAPNVPMIMVCENQDYRLLPFGVKSTDELKSEIAAGCA